MLPEIFTDVPDDDRARITYDSCDGAVRPLGRREEIHCNGGTVQSLDSGFLRDPYPMYARLRAESPIHRVRFSPVTTAKMTWRFARSMMRGSDRGILATLRGLNRARRQRAQSRGGGGRVYVLSRHADVTFALRRAEQFSSKAMGGGSLPTEDAQLSPTSGSLISVDPPEHRAHRGIVNRGFTPRRIAALEPHIRRSPTSWSRSSSTAVSATSSTSSRTRCR